MSGARQAIRILVLALGAVLSAASAIPGGPAGARHPRVEGIKLITAEQAARSKLEGRRYAVTFGNGQNGDALVAAYLEKARARGARYVSDIEVRLATEKDGTRLDCVTRTTAVPRTRLVPRQRLEQQPRRYRYVTRPVTRTVRELAYRCQMKNKPHQETESYYESRYDFASKRYRQERRTRTVTRYRLENECKNEWVTRTVTRYQHEYESEYQPPRWRTVLTTETDWEIVASDPECTPIDRAIKRPEWPHVISATIY